MSDRLKEIRERSQKRKELLAKAFGVASGDGLKSVLKSKEERKSEAKSSKSTSAPVSPPVKKRALSGDKATGEQGPKTDKDGEQENFEKDEVYKDSSTFLKGTQSANPHNDYCQHFVDTGERPQNFIRDVGLAMRFEEYPKLRELIRLKDELISTTNIPPIYKKCDLETFELSELSCQFDVILVEPPLEEYQRRGAIFDKYWDWDEIERLDIPSVAAQRSFIWIWCGNAEGLERGRKCLKLWGYRRCEDICWIKTNIQNPGHNKNLEPHSVIQRTKEHCLMGIKGTVKRSTDGDFIHANVDIDLIIEDEPPYGTKDKPIEIFHMIEHFCLGKRRLHVFGRDSTIRPGWLSLGSELSSSNYEPDIYHSYFQSETDLTTGCSDEIERLRPKSPNPKSKQFPGRGGRGGGQSRPGRGMRGGMRGGPGRGMRGMRGGPGRGFTRGAR